MKKALITGVTGQDGSYLAELLLEKGYKVRGLARRCSNSNLGRLETVLNNLEWKSSFEIVYGDLMDLSGLVRIMEEFKPDEVYNLAAQSHVRLSFDIPIETAECTGIGCLNVLEAMRVSKLEKSKFYQASSSELYGEVLEVPQKESTPFNPRSPYAVAKMFSFYITKNYRESYGMYAANGILFNHESPRRGEDFVTRKITTNLARVKFGLQDKFSLGNLDAKRDWGYAKDYVEAMWLMLQQEAPDDFVVATGETHSIREFLEIASDEAALDWKKVVETDPKLFRPAEVDILLGDATKAKEKLGWTPKVTFEELARLMMREDMKLVERNMSILSGKKASPQSVGELKRKAV